MNRLIAEKAVEEFLSADVLRNFQSMRSIWLMLRTCIRTPNYSRDQQRNRKIEVQIKQLSTPEKLKAAVASYITSARYSTLLAMAHRASRFAETENKKGQGVWASMAYQYKKAILNTLIAYFADTKRIFSEPPLAYESAALGTEVLCMCPSGENKTTLTLLFISMFAIHGDMHRHYEIVEVKKPETIVLHLPLNYLVRENAATANALATSKQIKEALEKYGDMEMRSFFGNASEY